MEPSRLHGTRLANCQEPDCQTAKNNADLGERTRGFPNPLEPFWNPPEPGQVPQSFQLGKTEMPSRRPFLRCVAFPELFSKSSPFVARVLLALFSQQSNASSKQKGRVRCGHRLVSKQISTGPPETMTASKMLRAGSTSAGFLVRPRPRTIRIEDVVKASFHWADS